VDLAAQKVLVGASPPGAVQPEEMQRLHEVVSPIASRLGYTSPSAISDQS
jgi:hypothetical protein